MFNLLQNIAIKNSDNLIDFITSKAKYKEFYEETKNWECYYNYLTLPNSNLIFTLFYAHYNDDYIIYDKEKNVFRLIHYTYPFDVNTGQYNNSVYIIQKEFKTQIQVWKHVIKPDIESYFGIKIEE